MRTAADASASLERLARGARPRILHVSHDRGGGVDRHLADLRDVLAGHADGLVLRPAPGDTLALRWTEGGADHALWFAQAEWEDLARLLASIGIDRVHVHHLAGLPRAILDLPSRLGCPHDVTVHDYSLVCSAFHMTDASMRPCEGGPGCRECPNSAAPPWGLDLDAWREACAKLLAAARRVIVPSEDAARRIRAFHPALAPVVWPHPEREAEALRAPARILVPGALSDVKGLEVLRACIDDAARRTRPLHFIVVGFVGRPLPLWPEAPCSITGQFRETDLPALLAQQAGNAIFFPAQCAETFSYTLSAALDSGLPIVATRLGAFPERLAAHPRATLVPWDAGPAAMNDALLAAAQSPSRHPTAPRALMTFDAFRASYLEGVERGTPGRGHPEVKPAWLAEPRAPIPDYPLAYLYEDGIVCGKASSRELLRRHAFDPDAVHADRDVRYRQLIEQLAATRAALEAARSRNAREEPAGNPGRESPLRRFLRRLAGR